MMRVLLIVVVVAAFAGAAEPGEVAGDAPPAKAAQRVASLLDGRCASCHGGGNPPSGLRLTKEAFPASVVGVASSQRAGTVLVSPGEPEQSYLLSKLDGSGNIDGVRMPAAGDYFDGEELSVVESWIAGLDGAVGITAAEPGRARHFAATRLVNLPTAQTIGARDIVFRVSHRFVPAATSGHDPDFFGLNGPAHIMLQLSFGITEDISASLAHSNLYNEYEAGLRWGFLDQGSTGEGPPLSAAVVAGGSLVTQDNGDDEVFSSDNMKLNAQLPVSRGFGDAVALLVVPSYSTNTNHWSDESDATFALGIGGRVRIARGLSLSGEWVPVLDGYSANYDGWAAGIDYEVGLHVFQVFGTNNTGVMTDQYLPGGYPELGSSDFRIGFNIFRTFRR